MSPKELKDNVERILDSDKALNIITVDLQNNSAIADYMIIATGTSSRHVAAMAEKLKIRLETMGHDHVRSEGLQQADWVVIDLGDVVVHLFREEVREFYNIEKMWGIHGPHIITDNRIQA